MLRVGVWRPWIHYEAINNSVDGSNKVFGTVMIPKPALVIALWDKSLYNVHNRERSHTCFKYFIWSLGNWSLRHVRDTTVSLMSRYWHLLDKQERNDISVSSNRLQQNQLTATPKGLYNITNANLLPMLQLLNQPITYAIIRCQWQWFLGIS